MKRINKKYIYSKTQIYVGYFYVSKHKFWVNTLSNYPFDLEKKNHSLPNCQMSSACAKSYFSSLEMGVNHELFHYISEKNQSHYSKN